MTESLNHHAALVYVMVTVSAVDRAMTDDELHRIGEIVSNLPVFSDYDDNDLVKTAEACGVAQPTLSLGIQSLEQMLNVPPRNPGRGPCPE